MRLVLPGWCVLAEGTGPNLVRSDHDPGEWGTGTGQFMLLHEGLAEVRRWQPVQMAEFLG